MNLKAVNFQQKFSLFTEQWKPKVVAEMNDYQFKVVRLEGDFILVVPKGVEHKPFADGEVKLLLVEPRGVLNTGHEASKRTEQNDVWI